MAKPRPEPFSDPRQPILFDELPLPPPTRSDRGAVQDMRELLDQLLTAKTHPWSDEQLWAQRRRFAAFAKLLTPIEAAAAAATFEAELERLGDPIDIWAELAREE